MDPNATTAESQVLFLLNVQRLLEEGSFVASYKHALLVAIADVCVEKGDDSGVPLRITTKELAEKFVSYYWRQAVPYFPMGADDRRGAILRQTTGRQAAIVNSVARARGQYGSLAKLKADRGAWRSLIVDVSTIIRDMPLWKLQTVGGQHLDFLYPNTGGGSEIELRPGVCYCFRLFYDLVHALVRGAWLRFVRGLKENRMLLGTASDLAEFMFGSDRAPLEVYRPLLIEYQSGACFYCLGPLAARSEVDHFIPWSRYPVDLGHNFVLTHLTCNRNKADRLAAVEHLEKWWRRNSDYGSEMSSWFQSMGLVHDLAASRKVAAWAYGHAQTSGALCWKENEDLVPVSPRWREILG